VKTLATRLIEQEPCLMEMPALPHREALKRRKMPRIPWLFRRQSLARLSKSTSVLTAAWQSESIKRGPPVVSQCDRWLDGPPLTAWHHWPSSVIRPAWPI